MKKRIDLIIFVAIDVILIALLCIPKPSSNPKPKPTAHKTQVTKSVKPYKDPQDLRTPGSWKKSSEAKAYPKISKNDRISVRVSIKGNRVYILRDGKVIYTMLSTAGLYNKKGKSYTPTGKFRIRSDRDSAFFNYELNEGARYWTSFSKNNVYLFHSIPTKENGDYNAKEGAKLGKTQGSHGCIRLSVPDAKWFQENIRAGTPVIIKND